MPLFHDRPPSSNLSFRISRWSTYLSEFGADYEVPQMQSSFVRFADYIQFLAARKIQSTWRGFYYRQQLKKTTRAAVNIQRWWRGFWERRNHFKRVEEKLQTALLESYNQAAIRIQSLFRGWRVRNRLQSFHLRKLQTCAAEELINCVALKLHYMMRTYSIPGVYSLRNSHCLSLIEKLLASINNRFYKGRFSQNALKIRAKSVCKPNCAEFVEHTRDMDTRMFRIIAAYDESERAKHAKLNYSLAEKRRRRKIAKILAQHDKGSSFCGDIIASMRRWKIWNGQNQIIDENIFRNPALLEKFLEEAVRIASDILNCPCKFNNYTEIE